MSEIQRATRYQAQARILSPSSALNDFLAILVTHVIASKMLSEFAYVNA